MSYVEDREQIKSEQSGMSYDDIKAILASKSEHMVELDNLPTQNHIWVDRGLKYSCEGAAHANHQAWKRGRAKV